MMKHDLSLLEQGLAKWDIILKQKQLELFDRYTSLLLEWNQKFNLTAITELNDIIIDHYLDSLAIFKTPYIEENSSIMDMGTGAGFPGIPIKILFPEMPLVLVDSLNKRTVFLKEVISQLDLKNIEVIHARAEDLGQNKQYRENYDLVLSRAVAELRVLSEYCLPMNKVNSLFISYKGPGAPDEIENAQKAIKTLGGQYRETLEIDVPFSEKVHNLVVIKKVAKTPHTYPRKSGKPKKSPM